MWPSYKKIKWILIEAGDLWWLYFNITANWYAVWIVDIEGQFMLIIVTFK